MCNILPLGFRQNPRWPHTTWVSMNIIQCCHNLCHQIPLVTRIRKMYSLTYLGCTAIELWWQIFLKDQMSYFGSTGVKFVKLVRFDWKWSQYVCLVNKIFKKNHHAIDCQPNCPPFTTLAVIPYKHFRPLSTKLDHFHVFDPGGAQTSCFYVFLRQQKILDWSNYIFPESLL